MQSAASVSTCWKEDIVRELKLIMPGKRLWEERFARQPDHHQRIQEFLEHAVATVPFYQDYFRKDTGKPALDEFPVISRKDILGNPQQFISQCANETSILLSARSSGTLGQPVQVYHDAASWYGLNYDTYRRMVRYIPQLASAFQPGEPGVVLVTNKPHQSQEIVVLPNLNHSLFQRLTIGQSQQNDEWIIDYLSATPVPVLYGKSFYLLQLAELKKRRSIRPQVIIVSGEQLFDDVRIYLQDAFHCPVYNAYMSVEGGLIACECVECNGLHVQDDLVKLEVLDGEIVLTNFFNRVSAFIRYRTGDKGTLCHHSCSCGFTGTSITDLPAREATHFNTISTRELDKLFQHLPVKQFQVIQSNKDIVINWMKLKGADSAAVEQTILSGFGTLFGNIPIYVHEVEMITKPGGKMRRYINEAE